MCFAAHTHTQGRVLNVCVCVRFGVIVGGGGGALVGAVQRHRVAPDGAVYFFILFFLLFNPLRFLQVSPGEIRDLVSTATWTRTAAAACKRQTQADLNAPPGFT